jgi:hypothetical protein
MRPPVVPSPRSSRPKGKPFSFEWVIAASPTANDENPPSPLFRKGSLGRFESHFLINVHPETRFFSSPSTGEEKGGGDNGSEFEISHFDPPHPNPLPLGERGFPDEN